MKVWDCLIISVNRAKLWQYVASLSPIYSMVTQWAEGPISFVPSEESIKCPTHSIIFPTGVVHRVENGWGLTKVAVVLLNGLLW